MRKELFPEAFTAYQHWCTNGELDNLNSIVEQGKIRWYKTARKILNAYNADEGSTETIETVINAANAVRI